MAKNKLHAKMMAVKQAAQKQNAERKPLKAKPRLGLLAISGIMAAPLLVALGISAFANNASVQSNVAPASIARTADRTGAGLNPTLAPSLSLTDASTSPLLAMSPSPLLAQTPAMPNVSTAPGSRYGGWLSPDRGDTGMSSPEPETPNPFRMSMQQQNMDPIDRALEPLVQAGRNEPMVVGPMIARQLRGFIPIAKAQQQMQLKDSLNPYAYVNNNPISYTDPSGLSISMPGGGWWR